MFNVIVIPVGLTVHSVFLAYLVTVVGHCTHKRFIAVIRGSHMDKSTLTSTSRVSWLIPDFVHVCVHVIYFCTFLLFVCTFFLSVCVLCFLLWAASYDGLMPSLAACHCNNWYVCVMYMYLVNKLSLSLFDRESVKNPRRERPLFLPIGMSMIIW